MKFQITTPMVVIVLFSMAFSVLAQTIIAPTKEEYDHKAKIISYLIKNVGWPATSFPKNSFNLCLLGEFPFIGSIKKLDGSVINKLKVKVSSISNLNINNNQCQLIYIAQSEEKNLPKIIKKFFAKPILLLGDMENFAKQGGSMNFTSVNGTPAIIVNTESLNNSHLVYDLKRVGELTVIPEEKDIFK